MKPRKYVSNSCAVLDKVPFADRASEVGFSGDSMLLHDGKILGVKYCPKNGGFFMVEYETPEGKASRRGIPVSDEDDFIWTKRTVLSLLFKPYDPGGDLFRPTAVVMELSRRWRHLSKLQKH